MNHDAGFGSKIKESVVPFIPPIKTRKRWYGFCDQSQIDARCNAFIDFLLFIFWLFTGCFFWLVIGLRELSLDVVTAGFA